MESLNNISKVNILLILFIVIQNTIISIVDDIFYIVYLFPFIISIILLFVIRKKPEILNSYILFFFAVIQSFLGERGNFGGVIFLIFSIKLYGSRNQNIIRIGIIIIIIGLKSVFLNMSVLAVINLIFLYSGSLVLYHILFYDKKKFNIEIDDQTEQIIFWLVRGYEIKEIAEKIYMSSAAVSKRIQRLKEKCGCKTVYELIYLLSLSGQHYKKWTKHR